MNRKKAPPRALLTLIFTIVVFIILVVTMIIVGCVIFFLTQIGVLGISQTASAPIHFQIIIFAMTSSCSTWESLSTQTIKYIN